MQKIFACLLVLVAACSTQEDPLGLIEQGICTEYACDSEGNNCSYFPSGCGTGNSDPGGGGGYGGGGGGGASCHTETVCAAWECEYDEELCHYDSDGSDYYLWGMTGYLTQQCITTTYCSTGYWSSEVEQVRGAYRPLECPEICP